MIKVIRTLPEWEMYCPYCGIIIASNIEEVESNKHVGYIFTHSENHTEAEVETDMEALNYFIQ